MENSNYNPPTIGPQPGETVKRSRKTFLAYVVGILFLGVYRQFGSGNPLLLDGFNRKGEAGQIQLVKFVPQTLKRQSGIDQAPKYLVTGGT